MRMKIVEIIFVSIIKNQQVFKSILIAVKAIHNNSGDIYYHELPQ